MSTKPQMSAEYLNYFAELQNKLDRQYAVAWQARGRGLDPSIKPEPEITHDIAERVEKLVGPTGIGERIRELEAMDRLEMAFKVAEEIAYGRFGKLDREKAADQAVRTALAIMTEGVTIAPIQGLPEIKIKQNTDRSQYLAVYFAGPIRPAGGTAQAMTLVVADFVRRLLGLERYKASEESVRRFLEEVRLYERSVRRFQYHVTDEDLDFALMNLPVEATGVGTDPYEVSSFRDVQGIETNRLRGGALIVVVDGIVGRAGKLCGICESLRLEGWEWLSKVGNADLNSSESKANFMEEIIVGRPVFSFPHSVGGFRLRYGRARNTGLAAVGVHPATMIILNKFLATGVQMRVELPGKSAISMPVDSIEPPIVRLKDGSVVRVETVEEAKELTGSVDAILFLGDMLVNAGDFLQNNRNLLPAGYDENQWRLDLLGIIKMEGTETFLEKSGIEPQQLDAFLSGSHAYPMPKEALAISDLTVPLHPRYTYLWSNVSRASLLRLRSNLAKAWTNSAASILPLDDEDKATLEELLVPHKIVDGGVILEEAAPILERCLALNRIYVEIHGEDPLEIVRGISGLNIKEKAPVYVGARMGRPEKAKIRKMSPYVHGLFPISNAGGPQRDILKVEKNRTIVVDLVNRHCPACGSLSFGVRCDQCGAETVTDWSCRRCGRKLETGSCPVCKSEAVAYKTTNVDIREIYERALNRIGRSHPERFKVVKSLMNEKRLPEPLEKGLLRALYDLSVFKDGTIRFDITDAPLTHFKPSEVGVPIDRLKELGYTRDKNGFPLEYSNQMLELKVQDVILPKSCGNHLVEVSKFIDELLTRFYGLDAYYGVNSMDELVGCLVLGLAPHTSAAVVGRVIGYTINRVCYAHPLWHAAKRRNCDGDEDAIMLCLDPLLNFSREFLPEQMGGLMDAPLFIIPVIKPSEVDKEALNVDVMDRYPPEFYRLYGDASSPVVYGALIDTIGGRLGTEAQFEGSGYTEVCTDINQGSHRCAYTSIGAMLEKLDSQLELSERLRAVDVKTVAMRILSSHFMKDIVGNLRAFTSQGFRCVKCNRRYRKPPLKGACVRCGGSLSLTVYKGGIKKYLEPAMNLVHKYDLGDYYADRLRLIEEEIASLFPEVEPKEKAEKKQIDLTDFLRS